MPTTQQELENMGLGTPELRNDFIRRNWVVIQRSLKIQKARKACYAGYVIAACLAVLVGAYGLMIDDGLNVDHYMFFVVAAFYLRRCSLRIKICREACDPRISFTKMLIIMAAKCVPYALVYYILATTPLHMHWVSGLSCAVWLALQLVVILVDGMDV